MSRRTAPLVSLNSCERIRPERPRNAIQRLVWVPGSQFHVGFAGGVGEDEGSNPRMALRRLLRLYEGRQYREAAGFLMRLPQYTLRAALPDIPIDLLIDTLPHSLVLLEALYARLLELGVRDAQVLRLEQLLWKVVGLLSNTQDHFHLRAWARLLSALNRAAPSARTALISRRRALERAVEGLGKHGLVPANKTCGGSSSSSGESVSPSSCSTSNLVPLPVALKEQLEMRAEAYKLALHKIESLGKHAGLHKGDQGVQAASHQRLLGLKYSEVQQRLIDNQSLLNTLERTRDEELDRLLVELKARVEQDKEALRQWTALRKCEAGAHQKESNAVSESKNTQSLAARLLLFSRGCAMALQLMNGGDCTLDSNNSSTMGEYDEEEEEEEESSSSAGYHTDESCSPTPEPNRGTTQGETLQGLACPDVTVDRLRERYAALYSQANLHTLDALDSLEPLKDAPELKAKILYSIVVLSWRLAGILQASRRIEALKVLNGGNSQSQASAPPDLEDCIRRQLATIGAQSGAREVAHQVTSQLERTLHDFPCLRNSAEVRKYALSCSRLAWVCLARTTPLVLDVAQGVEFRREVHARHHSSPNPNGSRIKAVLWPGLREGCQGPYLHRAVVVTC
ncbi:uncharacterized protein LOC100122845 [Nasonia vitripennis]|uniref:Mitochondria-eating protein n=1 Tax=Nasonia vitripennis TaxID=7425 RepID=A0A7M7IRW9_NASVI|nr:uncharacterized protein LOC100122845 [Nasonia vitripennis]